jgi:hypothetical protein
MFMVLKERYTPVRLSLARSKGRAGLGILIGRMLLVDPVPRPATFALKRA